jgi:quinol-cytochrome oxidoreductase complex cytochrome b subunit
VFYAPEFFGNPDNAIEANPLVTPKDIVPEWYLLPFYAILRSIPNKLAGVIALGAAILVLAFIPWLDTSRVRSCRFRPTMKWLFWFFVVTCAILGYCGSQAPDAVKFGIPLLWVARVGSTYYFGFFLVLMPLVGLFETPKPLPASISQPVLGE